MDNTPPLPSDFIRQMQEQLQEDFPSFYDSYNHVPFRGIRFRHDNSCLNPDETLSRIPYAHNAWYLKDDSMCGSNPLHEAGAYYIQEPSAMAACAVLSPQAGDKVLDLCAAPGGKSTQICMQADVSLLVANEPNPSRARILSSNIERMGIKSALVTCALPHQLSETWPRFFDRILVDAPCSGEGMFRRHPEARTEWHSGLPLSCHHRQTEILHHASLMLRSGGIMVYSTCTFNTTENELTIESFLRSHQNFKLLPIRIDGLPNAETGMLRLWPHHFPGEGHFIALLQKEDCLQDEKRSASPGFFPLPSREMKTAYNLLADEIGSDSSASGIFGPFLISAPSVVPNVDHIHLIRAGLHLGEMKGKVFYPAHALPLAEPIKKRIDLSFAEIRQYLHGDTLPCSASCRGFYALSFGRFLFGMGKAADGIIKNLYPKGLRKPI